MPHWAWDDGEDPDKMKKCMFGMPIEKENPYYHTVNMHYTTTVTWGITAADNDDAPAYAVWLD